MMAGRAARLRRASHLAHGISQSTSGWTAPSVVMDAGFAQMLASVLPVYISPCVQAGRQPATASAAKRARWAGV
jgi:hypothetical protein